MSDLRIATRRSRLAMAQAAWVAAELRRVHAGVEVELVEITTTGDIDLESSVTALTEIGAFVRAVQQAVLGGRADLAVHSAKDLPVTGPPGLVAFHPVREVPFDVLCGGALGSLPPAARVGTGSPRRTAQLTRLRPDLNVESVRGNVDTRIAKVESGELDAVVLAEAGLRRLGRSSAIEHRFSLAEMVPAPAQGALTVEAREGSRAARLAAAIDHAATRRAVEAERAVLRATRAGCRSALGVYGELTGEAIRLTGFVEDDRGARSGVADGTDPEGAAAALRRVLAL